MSMLVKQIQSFSYLSRLIMSNKLLKGKDLMVSIYNSTLNFLLICSYFCLNLLLILPYFNTNYTDLLYTIVYLYTILY